MPTEVHPFGLPPKEAVDWFRAKGLALSDSWLEVWQEEHAQAFTVAKVATEDLLADIRTEVDAAIADGITLHEFRKRLRPRLEAAGWWGESEVTDPETGEVKRVQLGSPRRLKTIYDTNLRQAHSAGRWERIQRSKERRPYLRYVHRFGKSSHANARPQHQQWHDVVLPVDHPFWDHAYPMNGWGCHCKIQQMSERDLERYGLTVSERAPELKMRSFVHRITGATIKVPEGIDPGFDYNVGKAPRGTGAAPPRSPVAPPKKKPLPKPKHGVIVGTHTPSLDAEDPQLANDLLASLNERELAILEHSKVKPRLSFRRQAVTPSGNRVAGWYGGDPLTLQVGTHFHSSIYNHPRVAGELFGFAQSQTSQTAFARSALHHEFGHHIHGEVGGVLVEAAYARAIARGPTFTRYAGTDPGEYFAEAYSAYRGDPEWLKASDPEAFEMVESMLGSARIS